MQTRRELMAVIIGMAVIIVFFICMFANAILQGMISIISLWGIPIGFLFGIATWLYLSEVWDPVNLTSTGSSRYANSRLLWLAPSAGIVLSRLLLPLFGETIADLIVLCVVTWAIFTLGYILVKVGWHHL